MIAGGGELPHGRDHKTFLFLLLQSYSNAVIDHETGIFQKAERILRQRRGFQLLLDGLDYYCCHDPGRSRISIHTISIKPSIYPPITLKPE
jgi:hypothetical protein